MIPAGVTVTVEPLAGSVADDAEDVDRVDGLDGVDQAEAGLRVPGARRRRRSSASAEAISPARISAGVAPGAFCCIRAATAAALGAAEDVPKKLGRFCDRLVGVAGWPGNGGLLVSIGGPRRTRCCRRRAP